MAAARTHVCALSRSRGGTSWPVPRCAQRCVQRLTDMGLTDDNSSLCSLTCKPTPEFSPAALCMPAACSCLGQGRLSPAWSERVNFHGSVGRSEQLHAVGYTHATATCTTSWHRQLHTATPVQAGCVQPPIPPGCTSPAAPIKGVCT